MKDTLEQAYTKAKIGIMGTNQLFFSTILFNTKQSFSGEIDTACTDGESILINPKYFMECTPKERVGLLLHEVCHIAYKHMFRRQQKDPHRWNIAADIVIDTLLTRANIQVPDSLADGKYVDYSTEEVYDLLPRNAESPKSKDIIYLSGDSEKVKNKIKQIEAKVDKAILQANSTNNTNKEAGNIPAEIARNIDKYLKSKVAWYVELQQYLTSKCQEDYSWYRPNRRTYPNYYLPSMGSPTLGDIVIAIDTSGSITNKDLSQILGEIKYIHDTYKPTELTIIDADSRIHNIYEVDPYTDITSLTFNGGGGTCFRPVIDYCNEKQPKVLIYFTDLYARQITTQPEYDIIWACTSDKVGKIGKTIHIEIE